MENLNEAFWKAKEIQYPEEVAKFKQWVDEYKKENNWNNLFNDNAGIFNGEKFVRAPKYHNLPSAMQFGIFIEYAWSQDFQKRKFPNPPVYGDMAEQISRWLELETRRNNSHEPSGSKYPAFL